MTVEEAQRRQAVYAEHRRAWSEAVGRAEVTLPLAEPGPLREEPAE